MKFLAMHITNKNEFWYIFHRHLQNIFMEHDLYLMSYDLWHKRKIYNFDTCNVFLDIATNIPQQDWFCAPGWQMLGIK